MKRIVCLVTIFLLATVLVNPNVVSAQKQTIKIAYFQPRTAKIMNFYGTWLIQGFHLGLEYATGDKNPSNLKTLLDGGEAVYNMPDGRKVVVKVFDTQGSPDIAVERAKEAIEDWGADILAGGCFSSVAAKIEAIAKEYQILYFMEAAAASLTQDPLFNKYVFRVMRTAEQDAWAQAYLAIEEHGFKTFGIMAIDYEFGWSSVEALQAAISSYPDCRIVAITWPPMTCVDFRPYLEPILAAQPDVFIAVWAGDFSALLRDLVALNVWNKTYAPWVGADFYTNNYLNFGIPGVEGILIGRECWVHDSYMKNHPAPLYQTLCEMVKEENITPDEFLRGHSCPQLDKLSYARVPETWFPGAFATAQFIIDAITAVPDLDTDRMIAHLEGRSLETPIGQIRIRPEDHQGIRPYFIGRFVIDNDTSSDTYGLVTIEYVDTIPAEKIEPRIMTTYTPYPKSFTVTASASPTTGAAPLTVSFTATSMMGTPPYTYEWDFGDGATSTEQNPIHTYENPGVYNVTVTSTDALGLKASSTIQIVVTEPTPTPITEPILWVLIIVIIALVIVVGALIAKRRK